MFIQDHLHLRGEYLISIWITGIGLGSSPLTWRILYIVTRSERLHQDHLHLRGEYLSDIVWLVSCLGSSPHTWRILEFEL